MIAKEVGVDNESIVSVLKTFTGVRHRLEFIDKVNGVDYYNDTEATNTKCTTIALSSFDKNVILILGGLERGQDFHDLDNFISPVKEIVGIGECRDRVKEYGDSVGIKTTIYEKLGEAMNYINSVVVDGDTVLLSPASASWDQYKQCEDRGDEFRDIVRSFKMLINFEDKDYNTLILTFDKNSDIGTFENNIKEAEELGFKYLFRIFVTYGENNPIDYESKLNDLI